MANNDLQNLFNQFRTDPQGGFNTVANEANARYEAFKTWLGRKYNEAQANGGVPPELQNAYNDVSSTVATTATQTKDFVVGLWNQATGQQQGGQQQGGQQQGGGGFLGGMFDGIGMGGIGGALLGVVGGLLMGGGSGIMGILLPIILGVVGLMVGKNMIDKPSAPQGQGTGQGQGQGQQPAQGIALQPSVEVGMTNLTQDIAGVRRDANTQITDAMNVTIDGQQKRVRMIGQKNGTQFNPTALQVVDASGAAVNPPQVINVSGTNIALNANGKINANTAISLTRAAGTGTGTGAATPQPGQLQDVAAGVNPPAGVTIPAGAKLQQTTLPVAMNGAAAANTTVVGYIDPNPANANKFRVVGTLNGNTVTGVQNAPTIDMQPAANNQPRRLNPPANFALASTPAATTTTTPTTPQPGQLSAAPAGVTVPGVGTGETLQVTTLNARVGTEAAANRQVLGVMKPNGKFKVLGVLTPGATATAAPTVTAINNGPELAVNGTGTAARVAAPADPLQPVAAAAPTPRVPQPGELSNVPGTATLPTGVTAPAGITVQQATVPLRLNGKDAAPTTVVGYVDPNVPNQFKVLGTIDGNTITAVQGNPVINMAPANGSDPRRLTPIANQSLTHVAGSETTRMDGIPLRDAGSLTAPNMPAGATARRATISADADGVGGQTEVIGYVEGNKFNVTGVIKRAGSIETVAPLQPGTFQPSFDVKNGTIKQETSPRLQTIVADVAPPPVATRPVDPNAPRLAAGQDTATVTWTASGANPDTAVYNGAMDVTIASGPNGGQQQNFRLTGTFDRNSRKFVVTDMQPIDARGGNTTGNKIKLNQPLQLAVTGERENIVNLAAGNGGTPNAAAIISGAQGTPGTALYLAQRAEVRVGAQPATPEGETPAAQIRTKTVTVEGTTNTVSFEEARVTMTIGTEQRVVTLRGRRVGPGDSQLEVQSLAIHDAYGRSTTSTSIPQGSRVILDTDAAPDGSGARVVKTTGDNADKLVSVTQAGIIANRNSGHGPEGVDHQREPIPTGAQVQVIGGYGNGLSWNSNSGMHNGLITSLANGTVTSDKPMTPIVMMSPDRTHADTMYVTMPGRNGAPLGNQIGLVGSTNGTNEFTVTAVNIQQNGAWTRVDLAPEQQVKLQLGNAPGDSTQHALHLTADNRGKIGTAVSNALGNTERGANPSYLTQTFRPAPPITAVDPANRTVTTATAQRPEHTGIGNPTLAVDAEGWSAPLTVRITEDGRQRDVQVRYHVTGQGEHSSIDKMRVLGDDGQPRKFNLPKLSVPTRDGVATQVISSEETTDLPVRNGYISSVRIGRAGNAANSPINLGGDDLNTLGNVTMMTMNNNPQATPSIKKMRESLPVMPTQVGAATSWDPTAAVASMLTGFNPAMLTPTTEVRR